ncbi:putative two-component response regulator [Alcanivorax sp. S71-1-4]|uniref:GGDEF domain-containing response regulator n=1 Tax=Alcanivorax sp. S71-1-4 TaxID=1177159 RepID=UPI00135A0A28|nr:response regulator [Alcanivorax sp. S71-1-4]KAF0808922.1 putative two-component response regulator [Alcanivorax sp. S71-1-4]
MTNPDTRVLVVDDTRFSATLVARTLGQAGYRDVRHASSASEALSVLAEQPAQIVIADWMMPDIDGLALTRRIRQMDEAHNRYTYVILLTAREEQDALRQAFDEGVDDFVPKSGMTAQLLPRVFAADRLVAMQNRILADNQRLLDALSKMQKQTLIDPLTGFGNQPYAKRRLHDALRHAHARGGAASLLLCRIDQFPALQQQLGARLCDQLLLAFSRRLKQMVRPLDIVARLAPDTFALITWQPDRTHSTAGSFKRLYDGLNHRAFQTTGGFHSLQVSISLCTADQPSRQQADDMFTVAHEALPESATLQRIVEAPCPLLAPQAPGA